jgi:hypothetical protein
MAASRDDGEEFGLDLCALQMQAYGMASTLPISDARYSEPSSPAEPRYRFRRDLPIGPSSEERKRRSGARIIFAAWFGLTALAMVHAAGQYAVLYNRARSIADKDGNGLSRPEYLTMCKEMGIAPGNLPSGTALEEYVAKYDKS